jgi:UPF0755 protein
MKDYLIFLFFVVFLLLFVLPKIFLAEDPYSQTSVLFLIKKGQGFLEISKNLELTGVIKNKFYFDFYLVLTGDYKKLQAGQYFLSPSMIIPEIVQRFVSGETNQIKVTIPEGFICQQIETELNSKLQTTTPPPPSRLRQAPRSDLCQLLMSEFKSEFDFFKNAPEKVNLEGFLFPDTYYFSVEETNEEIIQKFLINFAKKLKPELKEETNRQGKTIFEIVTMASMIEKEVKTFEDKKLVSGILWKRLKNGMPLQVDATISYITGKKSANISVEETKIDSPYNTYKYKGLPLGPISNPGLDSILAAIYPEESNYWYYLSTPEGKTIFSKTLEEHNIAKAKYLK